jgi:DNA mismatch repair protein MutS
MTIYTDYFDITKKYKNEYGENTILLMQNGAFYEVYALRDNSNNIFGSNIVEFGNICDLNVGSRKASVEDDQVMCAGFKTEFLDRYVKKLQDTGYTIVVYDQDEQCANTTRSLSGIYSPGTYFSCDNETITNNTCCIWLESKKSLLKTQNILKIYVGASVIDIYTGKTSMMEYNEVYLRNPTTFDELEHFISINNPSETIIISNLTKNEIDDIVSYANIRSKTLHIVNLLDESNNKNVQRALNCEKQTYQTQLLIKFYKPNDIDSYMHFFYQYVWGTQSFCYLLDFIYQHNPHLVHKISEPIINNNSKKLVLANHSLKQLNIIEENKEYRGKYSSVLKMLNECITPMGKRKFANNFVNPTSDEEFLQKEYDIIGHILLNMDDYKIIKTLLASLKDISKINRQIMLQKVSPKSIYQLYASILSCKDIFNFIIKNDVIKNYLKEKVIDFDNLLIQMDEFILFLDNNFIMEQCKDIDNIQKIEESFIQIGVDNDLDEKINILLESQDQLEGCRSYLSSIISNYENTTKSKKTTKRKKSTNDEDDDGEKTTDFVKIHETQKNNFSLIATDRRCKILDEVLSKKNVSCISVRYKSRFHGDIEKEFLLEIGSSLEYGKQSDSYKYISNPQINKLCKNLGSIKVNWIDTIIKVYNKKLCDLDNYQSHLENICQFITYIDLIYTKAFIADKYNYCKPLLETNDDDKSFVDVKGLRHCLIEKLQQGELYVTNDIRLGDGKLDGILLYGTNAVGKTSFIRALGISIVMAQAGLFVPATTFSYKPYKYIFTRILGNDNLFKGLSTFAVEMSELRTILRLANKNSLVLGDELCSGTESISAVSIFVAGIQALHKQGCSFIFATHLHEIIGYEEINSLHNVGMKHMSVMYDRENDVLIYNRKLADGPGNNMYGLEVCKSLNLPQDFLENAHNIRTKYHPASGSILDLKPSRYNAKHIKSICENCKIEIATEVHHLQHQQDANNKGIIQNDSTSFHKNHPANLSSLCEKCHDEIHKTGKKHKKVKTTKGNMLVEIS